MTIKGNNAIAGVVRTDAHDTYTGKSDGVLTAGTEAYSNSATVRAYDSSEVYPFDSATG